jgi:hypothetical protein
MCSPCIQPHSKVQPRQQHLSWRFSECIQPHSKVQPRQQHLSWRFSECIQPHSKVQPRQQHLSWRFSECIQPHSKVQPRQQHLSWRFSECIALRKTSSRHAAEAHDTLNALSTPASMPATHPTHGCTSADCILRAHQSACMCVTCGDDEMIERESRAKGGHSPS